MVFNEKGRGEGLGRAQRLPAKAEGQYLLSHVSMSVESDTHGGSNAQHAPGEHAEYRLRHNRDEEVSLDARIYIYIDIWGLV